MNQRMRLLKLRCLSSGGFYKDEVLPNGVRIGVKVVGKKTIWELGGENVPAKTVTEYMGKLSGTQATRSAA